MSDYEYFRSMARIYDALAEAESYLMCFGLYQDLEGGHHILKNVRACFASIENEFEPKEDRPVF